MTKKLLFSVIAIAIALMSGLYTRAAAAPLGTRASVTVSHARGTVEVPYNPRRVAILDMSVLDMLDAWGLGERVLGMPKDSRVGHLMKYADDNAITNLGNLKEVNMEALNSLEPDVIFIGGRLSAEYDKLSEIAPVVLMTIDNSAGYMNGFKVNVAKVASIFGKETESMELIAGFDARLAALKAAVSGKTAIVGMVTSSSFNALPDGSRCSLIGNEAGFTNLTKPGASGRERGRNPNAGQAANPHGDSASFELLVEKNPDYIFVLDRDAAIGAAGSKVAREVMENELVQKTDAYKNGRIVYLTPDVWYLAEGGITATDVMIRDLEEGLKD
ncbi:MAG: ABC transporter substrate-binding protein [Synergistaceae bacterium]|jgi:iron complex transport system substrate-binding protein|nr:ABC transporter substrate-binding protein [Synergistaceae bacterium]